MTTTIAPYSLDSRARENDLPENWLASERGALQRLMGNNQISKIGCVAAYKLDRRCRSLLDIARAMEMFDKPSVYFASVT